MSPERTQAYRRVMRTIDELGPSKLLGSEQDRIRHAADNLIFSSDLASDSPAREALHDIEELCTALVDSGRWESVTAERLERDMHACGPDAPIAAAA
jgi:nitrogen-specific signal transduction histidine kinase